MNANARDLHEEINETGDLQRRDRGADQGAIEEIQVHGVLVRASPYGSRKGNSKQDQEYQEYAEDHQRDGDGGGEQDAPAQERMR
jgi:hypothetical protein